MRHADHKLVINGTWEGELMTDLLCLHDQTRFFKDSEGRIYDYCLVQEWYDNDGRDVIGHSTTLTPEGHILLWTTWNLDECPVLVGRAQYQEWKEGLE